MNPENDINNGMNLPAIPKRKTHFLHKLLIALLVLVLVIAAFVFGLLAGGKYGVTLNSFDVGSIPFTLPLLQQIAGISNVNYDITLPEDMLNRMVQEYEGNFTPLRNIYLNPDDGFLTVSGQITTSELKSTPGISVPEIVMFFLPPVLNIKSDIYLSGSGDKIDISVGKLTLLNSEDGNELLSLSGFDSAIKDIAQEMLNANIPENITVEAVSVSTAGINVKGKAAVISLNEQ